MNQATQVGHYQFDIKGLTVEFDGVSYSYDPAATCNLLELVNMIEGFAADRNGEPVIIYSKECEDGDGNWLTQTGFCEWYEFVKTFPFNDSVAVSVMKNISNAFFQKPMQTTIGLMAVHKTAA